MKTTTKSLAFLLAVVAFAACTDRAIEPVKPALRPQPPIVRLDTIPEPSQPKNRAYNQLLTVDDTR